jgi:ankyrin repeat protein
MTASHFNKYADTRLGRGWRLLDEVNQDNPDMDLCRDLIKADTDLAPHGRTGSSTLHWAIYKGHAEIVSMLVAASSDMNALESDGETAVTAAITYNHADIAIFLVQSGADPNKADKFKNTPLCLAAFKNMPLLVDLLIDCGADPKITNDSGMTPADIARQEKFDTVLDILNEPPAARAARKIKEHNALLSSGQGTEALPRIKIRKNP